MVIGILSDTHGDAGAARWAVELLERNGATALFHCGDVCGEGVLDALAGHRAYFVWGNCDDTSPAMRRYVEAVGLSLPTAPLRLELAGKRIAMCHGHESSCEAVLSEAGLDYFFHGHTHVREDRRANGIRIVNPGALYRARVKTVATLDLTTDQLIFWTLDGQVAP